MRKRYLVFSLMILVMSTLFLMNSSVAAPLDLPNPLILVSNQGQAGANVDQTLIQSHSADPDPDWRERFYDAASWQNAYPVQRESAWASGSNIDPLLDDGADHIWGGTPGTFGPDAGNFTTYLRREGSPGDYDYGYEIPASPSPQYLFLRKDFCLPLNVVADADRRLTTGGGLLMLLNATDDDDVPDGAATVYLNNINLRVVSGEESNTTTAIPIPYQFLYRGRNALALRAGDARSDAQAAILYRAALDYATDPNAIALNITPTSPFVGEPVEFSVATDGLSDRGPYSYAWDFGAGSPAVGSSARHTYTETGTYTITLGVSDTDNCTATATTALTVLPAPLAIAKSAHPDPVTAGEALRYRLTVENQSAARPLTNVVITDTLPPGTTFDFCSGGCAPPTPPDRTVAWTLGSLGPSSSTSFDLYVNVALTVSGVLTNATYGARATEAVTTGQPLTVTVQPPSCVYPLESVTLSGPTEGYTATTYTFTGALDPADPTTPLALAWAPEPLTGQGTLSAAYQWAAVGTYPITLTAENCGGAVSATHAITISARCPHPLTDLGIAGPSAVDAGAPVSFTAAITPADATAPLTTSWTPAPLAGQDTPTATYQWDAPGAYTLTLRAENCGGIFTATRAITVTQPPTCPAPLTGVALTGPRLGETDTAITFTAAITPAAATRPITTTWTPAPVAGQDTLTATYRWPDAGTHIITVTTENCGGMVSATHAITISAPPPTCPAPLTDVDIVGPGAGEINTPLVFSAAITPANATPPITYTWLPAPLTGQDTPTATYQWDAPDVYTLTLRAENCGDVVTTTHAITISAPPTCPVPLTDVAIVGPSSGYIDTRYTFGAQLTPITATPPITYTWLPAPLSGQGDATAAYRWLTLGAHTITLRAENCGGAITATHAITLSERPLASIYLPLVMRNWPDDAPGRCPGWLIEPGESYRKNFDHYDDRDWFMFEATAGLSYTLRTDDLEIYADTVITLYDSSCLTPLAHNDDIAYPNDLASEIMWLAQNTGPLHLEVQNFAPHQYGAQTGYTLRLYRESAPPDDEAPGTCPGQMIDIGTRYPESFQHANDNDWFTFETTAGRTYVIATDDLGPRADTMLELWSGDCVTQLAQNDDVDPGVNLASQIEWQAQTSGRLSAMVRSYDWTVYGEGTEYTLTVYIKEE